MQITIFMGLFMAFLMTSWLGVMGHNHEEMERKGPCQCQGLRPHQRHRRQLFHSPGPEPHIPVLSHLLPSQEWRDSHIRRPIHNLFHTEETFQQDPYPGTNNNHNHGHHHNHNHNGRNLHNRRPHRQHHHHHHHEEHRRNHRNRGSHHHHRETHISF